MTRDFIELFYFKIYSFLKDNAPSSLGIESTVASIFVSLLFYLKFLILCVIVTSLTIGFAYLFISAWLFLFSWIFFIWAFKFYLSKRHSDIFRKYKNRNKSQNLSYFIYTITVIIIFIVTVYFCSKYY
jgi:membrane-associated HD superfamily phosphohydrolase